MAKNYLSLQNDTFVQNQLFFTRIDFVCSIFNVNQELLRYNQEERIGVYAIAQLFTEQLGWIFREQPVNDFGIDGFVEITRISSLNGFEPTGKLIAIQIKSGRSFFKEISGEQIFFRGEKKHLEYWLHHSIPVLLLLYDKESGNAYWQVISPSTIQLTAKSFKVPVPIKNKLSRESKEELISLGYFKNTYEYKFWQLNNSLNQMQLLQTSNLFCYVEIDSVTHNGDYHINIVLTNEGTGSWEEIMNGHLDTNPNSFSYTFFLRKRQDLQMALSDIMPWADFYIDSEVYRDEKLANSLKVILNDMDDKDLKNEVLALENGKSYIELVCILTGSFSFRLEVKPNSLLTAFLKVRDYLDKEPAVRQRLFV